MDTPRLYSLPEPLLQQIVNVLNELPARVSRGLLNEIEAHAAAQDTAAAVQTPAPAGGAAS